MQCSERQVRDSAGCPGGREGRRHADGDPDAGVAGAYTLQAGSASVSGNVPQVSLVMSGTFTSGGTAIDVTVSLVIAAMLK